MILNMKTINIITISILAYTLLSCETVNEQPDSQPAATPSQAGINYYNAPSRALEDYRQWKFGVLIQWNPSVLGGLEIGWSRSGPRGIIPASLGTGQIPIERYDNFYREFNAEHFDALKMCQTFKNAGIRYAAFCNKHHDGFCMWDTKLSDYKITSPECPTGRDLTREWADACRATGIKHGIYFSQPDWYDKDYFNGEEEHANYLVKMHGWVKELCSNYGQVDYIFFDGLGGLAKNWDTENLFKMIREIQPDAIINSRCGAFDVQGWSANRFLSWDIDVNAKLPMTRGFPGDFDTPEHTMGDFYIRSNGVQTDRPWETVFPLQKDAQWQYDPKAELYASRDLIHKLVRIVGYDGNLLVSPPILPDGRLDPRAEQLLNEIGDWLKQYGETIFGTRGGPYFPVADKFKGISRFNPEFYKDAYIEYMKSHRGGEKNEAFSTFGVSTYRGDTIFLHILEWPDEPISLPPIQIKMVSAFSMLGDNGDVTQDSSGAITISRIKVPNHDSHTIIAIVLDGPAKDAKPGKLALGSLCEGKKATASNVYSGLSFFAPENAVDDDKHTRWATDYATKEATLEVDLGEKRRFNSVLIMEDLDLVRKFEVQYKKDKQWITVTRGDQIGPSFQKSFDPVSARYVRLKILDAVHAPQYPLHPSAMGNAHMVAFPGPTIWEFQVLSNGS